MEKDTRLGRLIVPDERDKGFPMSSVLRPQEPGRKYRYWWPSGWWGDQGWTPHCVAYSWLHFVEDGPITHPQTKGISVMPPEQLYSEAQLVDTWPGEDYDGTSVRAGADRLRHHGYIKSYWWAWDVDTVVEALLTTGPVVVGTYWHNNMFYPDDDGMVTTGGGLSGGHAYLLNGVNIEKGVIRIKNSWGRQWGKNGYAYISIEDMGSLIDNYGEACIANELSPEEV